MNQRERLRAYMKKITINLKSCICAAHHMLWCPGHYHVKRRSFKIHFPATISYLGPWHFKSCRVLVSLFGRQDHPEGAYRCQIAGSLICLATYSQDSASHPFVSEWSHPQPLGQGHTGSIQPPDIHQSFPGICFQATSLQGN